MLTADQCQKLVAAAFFALPLVSVKVVDITLSESGPTAVSAAQPAAASPAVPLPAAAASQPASVGSDMDASIPASFGPNPFYYLPSEPSRAASAAAPRAERSEEPGGLASLEKGDFAVGLIMSQPNGDWAVINGETCRVGQRIGQTPWRLAAVDSRERSVTLENTQTGQILTRSVELRKP